MAGCRRPYWLVLVLKEGTACERAVLLMHKIWHGLTLLASQNPRGAKYSGSCRISAVVSTVTSLCSGWGADVETADFTLNPKSEILNPNS